MKSTKTFLLNQFHCDNFDVVHGLPFGQLIQCHLSHCWHWSICPLLCQRIFFIHFIEYFCKGPQKIALDHDTDCCENGMYTILQSGKCIRVRPMHRQNWQIEGSNVLGMCSLTVKLLTPIYFILQLWVEPQFFILDYPPDHARLAVQVKDQLEENFKELDLCFELSSHI